MKKILISTGNQGKFGEMMEVLEGLECEFFSLKDFSIDAEAVEDGDTFAENALIKAKFFYDLNAFLGRAEMPVIAEDSGILVDALPGELGVKTRRWGAGANANDEEWIEFFLNRMESVPDEQKGARFVCSAVYYDGGEPIFFNGETTGFITKSLQAPIVKGLPLSSCFVPTGHEKVYAALSKNEKNLISHRGKALHALKTFLFDRQKSGR